MNEQLDRIERQLAAIASKTRVATSAVTCNAARATLNERATCGAEATPASPPG